jgi:hypothetical protein
LREGAAVINRYRQKVTPSLLFAAITLASIRDSFREADTAQKILETSVGPQGIEGRSQQNGGVESRFIALESSLLCTRRASFSRTIVLASLILFVGTSYKKQPIKYTNPPSSARTGDF